MTGQTRVLLIAILTVLAAGVLSVGVATGMHDGNTIHACAKNQGGTLRLVQAAGECLPSETPVEWNVEGPQGPQGEQGEQGEQGLPGTSGYEAVEVSEEYDGDIGTTVWAPCPTGKRVLGGGYQVLTTSGGVANRPSISRPIIAGTGTWVVTIPTGGADAVLTVFAICAFVQ